MLCLIKASVKLRILDLNFEKQLKRFFRLEAPQISKSLWSKYFNHD